MKSNYKPIGEYIQLVDERNKGLQFTNLLGISVTKQFIPSVANIIGTDMENYKIIRKNQFACSIMQVRRDKKMPVALYVSDEPSIISQAYPIFEIKDTTLLLPEYLMMWFTRSEFDRQACFNAVGGVRGSLEWEDFCLMQLPIPFIEKQREIVKEYNVIQNRIALNTQLIAKLEEMAQTIYKQWFVDFEFPFDFAQGKPDENGKPYKSNGGEMEWCEELEKDVPVGWEKGRLDCYIDINRGASPRPIEDFITYNESDMPWIKISDATNTSTAYIDNTVQKLNYKGVQKSRTVLIGDLILSNSASPGLARILNIKACVHDGWLLFKNYKIITKEFLIELLKYNKQKFISEGNGSVFTNLKTEILKEFYIVINNEVIQNFTLINSSIYGKLNNLNKQNLKLEELNDLILARMTRVEREIEIDTVTN